MWRVLAWCVMAVCSTSAVSPVLKPTTWSSPLLVPMHPITEKIPNIIEHQEALFHSIHIPIQPMRTMWRASIHFDRQHINVIMDTSSSDLILRPSDAKSANPDGMLITLSTPPMIARNTTIHMKWPIPQQLTAAVVSTNHLSTSILGIGLASTAKVSPLGIFTDGVDVISFFFSNQYSYVSINDIPDTMGDIFYVPIVNKKWMIELPSIHILHSSLECDDCTALVDTSTTLIRGPVKYIKYLLAIIRRYQLETKDTTEYNCNDIDHLPTFRLEIGERLDKPNHTRTGTIQLEIEPSIYMRQFGKQCLPALVAMNGKSGWVFGTMLMHKFITIFDVDKERIGFGLSPMHDDLETPYPSRFVNVENILF